MDFQPSTAADLDLIFEFYAHAIAYQKRVSKMHWQEFDRALVEREISEGRQWKIMVGGAVGCVFVTTFSDPEIWAERDREPSIYLHRIVTHPDFRGANFVPAIIEWAKNEAKTSGLKYVRLDTWGDNQKLHEYYVRCGFRFLGIITPTNLHLLPSHYDGIRLALFEIEVG